MTKVKSEQYYSLRETARLLPWINCEPTLQKQIDADILNNGNKTFKAIVLKRNKIKRYFIKGEIIINLIKEAEAGTLVHIEA